MNNYILNKNKQDSKSGNNYEVHNEDSYCGHLPLQENRIDLGRFSNCKDAVSYAKRNYPLMSSDIDGCYYCCYACHNG